MLAWTTTAWKNGTTAIPAQRPAGGEEAVFAAGQRVATAMGWRAVEALAPGDLVLTFDNGMQPLVAVERVVLPGPDHAPQAAWPLWVPDGALGNAAGFPMWPGQAVVLESDAAEEIHGDPFALVPAVALEGFRGIAPIRPAEGLQVVRLVFARDEIVFAASGAMVLCPRRGDFIAEIAQDRYGEGYRVLSLEEADALVALIEAELDAAVQPGRSAA